MSKFKAWWQNFATLFANSKLKGNPVTAASPVTNYVYNEPGISSLPEPPAPASLPIVPPTAQEPVQYDPLANAHETSAGRQWLRELESQRRQFEFQREMSNTAHQRQVADLIASGLNPVLSATGGYGAATPSGAMAHSAKEQLGDRSEFDDALALTDTIGKAFNNVLGTVLRNTARK